MDSQLQLPEMDTPNVDNWCYTVMHVVKLNYVWTINNFSYCRGVLSSSVFEDREREKIKWCLRLNPKGIDDESKDYISVYLLLVSCDKPEKRAKFKFSVLNSKREETKIMEAQRPYCFRLGKDWGFKKFIRRDLLFDPARKLLPNDQLTIFCEISVISESSNISGRSNVVQVRVPECRLTEDMQMLFDNPKFSDVTLLVKGRVFHAHKSILASRSPVFAAIFEQDTEEKKCTQVNIVGVDHKVILEMLRYMYTGKVVNLDTIALELLAVANKYDIDRLKVTCEEALYNNLSIENASQILTLAHVQRAWQLKVQTLDFISSHATEVMDTRGWDTMAKSHPHLVADAFRALATQRVPPTIVRRRHFEEN